MDMSIGNNILIREFLYGDAPGIARNGDNHNIAINQRDGFPSPYTLEHARSWIQYIKQNHADTRFVIATPEEAIGEIGFIIQPDVHRNSGELAYWLGERFWGQGIITRALEKVVTYAFEEKNVYRLYADIIEYNMASQKVLQKCGFQIDGVMRKHIFKNGNYYDQLVFSRLADDHPPPLH